MVRIFHVNKERDGVARSAAGLNDAFTIEDLWADGHYHFVAEVTFIGDGLPRETDVLLSDTYTISSNPAAPWYQQEWPTAQVEVNLGAQEPPRNSQAGDLLEIDGRFYVIRPLAEFAKVDIVIESPLDDVNACYQ